MSTQRTIKFINEEASSIHGNLRVGSIYTSESGEWKLGGFEILSSVKDDDAIIYVREGGSKSVVTADFCVSLELWQLNTGLGQVCTPRASVWLGCNKEIPPLRC